MPHRNQKIFDEGWKAWTDGALIQENPHSPYTEITDANEYGAWEDGWMAAQEDQEEQDKEADRAADRIDFEYDRWHDDQ